MDIERYLPLIEGKFADKFSAFKEELLSKNKQFNLTSIEEEEGVKIKHFLDSLAAESFIENSAAVLEVGSGGGFPSIPLKIVRDDLSFTLVESINKKCVYLQGVVDKLALGGVQVVQARAEELSRQVMHRESYDLCTARAVARLNTLCEYCLPFVKTGGLFIAYKGEAQEETDEAARAITVLGGKLERVEKYCLPDGSRRSLIIIRKIKPTPEAYPRGRGKERKNPIV